jgi:hypothetical protein
MNTLELVKAAKGYRRLEIVLKGQHLLHRNTEGAEGFKVKDFNSGQCEFTLEKVRNNKKTMAALKRVISDAGVSAILSPANDVGRYVNVRITDIAVHEA